MTVQTELLDPLLDRLPRPLSSSLSSIIYLRAP